MGVKLVRKPKSPKVLHDIVRAEVAKNLKPIAEAAVIARRRVVANWKNKPDWQYRILVKPDAIRVIIQLKRPKALSGGYGGNTNDLWKWIDRGTRAHPITAKNKPLLKFQAGDYQAKTGAKPARYGGPGMVKNPQWVAKKTVNHPGFPGREFTQAINKDLRPKFNNAVDSGYRKGFAKVSR